MVRDVRFRLLNRRIIDFHSPPPGIAGGIKTADATATKLQSPKHLLRTMLRCAQTMYEEGYILVVHHHYVLENLPSQVRSRAYASARSVAVPQSAPPISIYGLSLWKSCMPSASASVTPRQSPSPCPRPHLAGAPAQAPSLTASVAAAAPPLAPSPSPCGFPLLLPCDHLILPSFICIFYFTK